MSNYKRAVLQRFDRIIQALEELIADMPEQSYDRYSRGDYVEDTPQEQITRFYRIRSDYLELLNSIPSQDQKIQAAIDHVRDIDIVRFNVDRVLKGAKELRSDYEAGLLLAAKSSGNKLQIAEQMLRESLYEVEHFQAPYEEVEIDRLEKQIKSAVNFAFDDESKQYQEIHRIFHPKAGLTFVGGNPDVQLKHHIKEWDRNRHKLLNSLRIMIDEIRLLQTSASTNVADVSLNQKLDTANRTIRLFVNGLWLSLSSLVAILIFFLLRIENFYVHPNKFALDISISLFFSFLILFLSRPGWRKIIASVFFVNLANVVLQLLAGMP